MGAPAWALRDRLETVLRGHEGRARPAGRFESRPALSLPGDPLLFRRNGSNGVAVEAVMNKVG